MMSAQDKNQVIEWSQRQLGAQARLVSISEKDVSETDGFVEREGTGITATEAYGCQPLISTIFRESDFVHTSDIVMAQFRARQFL